MKKLSWRLILRIIAILIVIASIVWLALQPGPEPVVGLLSAFGALIASLVGEEHQADEASIAEPDDSQAPAEEPTVPRPRIVNLRPLDVTHTFKDREKEIIAISRLLANPATRLVSVIGQGGMGKTALVCKLLAELEHGRWPHIREDADPPAPPDGILYLSTRTVGISLERLFLDCAKLLNEERQERLNAIWASGQLKTGAKISRLLETLRDGQYVILLDNLEDVLDDAGQMVDRGLALFVEQCLLTSCTVRLLVTSRIALALSHETRHFDCQINLLHGLPAVDAAALLCELDTNSEYGLRDAPDKQIAQAVSMTHGVPRALEVLVGILANDPFAHLSETVGQFYAQEDVVNALVEENYKRLDPQARQVIEALAVFRRPVPPQAAAYLLEPFFAQVDVSNVVRRLVRTNIVTVDRGAQTVNLHPIDQDYAYAQLPESNIGESGYTRQALERCAADYYLQLRSLPETWESIDDLEPQLAGFEHCVCGGEYDRACRVLNEMDRDYLYRWGHFSKLIELRYRLVDRLTAQSLQAGNWEHLGLCQHSVGQFERSNDCHKRSRHIYTELGDHKRAERQTGYIGRNHQFSGRLDKALECYEIALSVARRTGDRRYEGVWLGYLGYTHNELGQFDLALDRLQEALAIARDPQIADRSEEARCLGNLGGTYSSVGNLEKAFESYDKALAIVRDIQDRRYEGIWLGGKGYVYQKGGDIQQAIDHYHDGLRIARDVQDLRHESMWLAYLGRVYMHLGQFKQATEHLEQALALAQSVGARRQEISQLGGLSVLHLSQGCPELATKYHTEALTAARELNADDVESYQLLQFGRTLLHVGNLAEARQKCVQASELQVSRTKYLAVLVLAITCLHEHGEHDPTVRTSFTAADKECQLALKTTSNPYKAHYALAVALVGKSVSSPFWKTGSRRPQLLAPALTVYQRALDTCSAKGVVQDALGDLELIRAAGVEGLEPVFELLQSAIEDDG